MTKIAIVSDSSACLPSDLIEQFNITIVPLGLLIDGQPYPDSSLSAPQFYQRLREAHRLPTTTSPPPGAFLETYKQLAKRFDAILCITLSSKFSATYSAATKAAQVAHEEMPGLPIRVLDSHSLAMSHGFVVLAAARAAAAVGDLEAALQAAQAVAERAVLFGALDTLRYLAKSGRVPWIVHWAASPLQIKPLLIARQEEIKRLELVRTRRRALERLLDHSRQYAGDGQDLHVAVMHADSLTDAEALADRIRRELHPDELLITEFTSVMGIHAGPGFIGVALDAATPTAGSVLPARAGRSRPHNRDTPLEKDVRRIEASLAPLPPSLPRPALVVVSGLPGSGKSHFTRQLGQRFPLARLESDALRKALFPTPTHSPEESARLFAACHRVLDRLLDRGVPAVLDATNLREIHRRQLYRIATKNNAKLILVSLEAPEDVLRQRLDARQRGDNPWDFSDAGVAVYERMRQQVEPIRRRHIRIDTSRDIERGLRSVLRQLEATASAVPLRAQQRSP